MCEGIARELRGINLGDKRLNKRSERIIEALAANPQASVNSACDGWPDTLAAYRFFDNDSIEASAILEPHIEATKQRINEHSVVLIIQDTTEFDYTSHPPEDSGVLNEDYRFGFFDHTHLAITPDRLPLGIVGVEEFERTPESLGKTKERKSLPIEEKESFRWLKGYRLAAELNNECGATQIVSVADRECDIYDIFVEAQKQSTPTDYLIRAKEDRSTPEPDPDSGPYTFKKVRNEVLESEVRVTRTIELTSTPKREARTAELEIRAIEVTVKPPQHRPHLPSVIYNVVLVKEINGPEDGTDVEWLLITTLPIDSIEDVLLVIDYYVARWTIEIYFKVLKSGCRVEDIQLETKRRVKNCLMFYRIIAWRVMYLTYLNRTCPTIPCDVFFTDSEWKSVWSVTTKKPLPKQPPTLSEFISLLSRLGGHNNRAGDRDPGPQAIWVGIRRMTDFARAWLAFGPT